MAAIGRQRWLTRSFALSAVTPNGGQINQLLEQQQPGEVFVTAGGKAVGGAQTLVEAVRMLLAQLCKTHSCRAAGGGRRRFTPPAVRLPSMHYCSDRKATEEEINTNYE